jgi:prefoldin subunit 5
MDDLKQQVDRLEWRVDLHEEQLQTLQDNATELKEQLDCINKSLLQIKWLVVGGAVVYWAQAMGFNEVIKLVGGI